MAEFDELIDRFSEDLDLYLFAPILEKLATLHELRTIYTLDDLVDFHTAMSFQQQKEKLFRKMQERAQR